MTISGDRYIDGRSESTTLLILVNAKIYEFYQDNKKTVENKTEKIKFLIKNEQFFLKIMLTTIGVKFQSENIFMS
jgi:hypothetical protein